MLNLNYTEALTPESTNLKEVIATGSKSFYFASLLFSEQTRWDSWIFYRWCRLCDDKIDNAGSQKDAEAALLNLRENTLLGLQTKTGPVEFQELGELFERYKISHCIAGELLSGFEKDVRGFYYKSIDDVESYAYQVAGVVGLAMARIMGVTEREALQSARDMGMAMQLTNIARDVLEDYQRGRIYLPQDWLTEEGIIPAALFDDKEKLLRVVERLLRRADELYRLGFRGLKYLPFRASLAVSTAAIIYAKIGRNIQRHGVRSLTCRSYVRLPGKFIGVLGGFVMTILSRVQLSREV